MIADGGAVMGAAYSSEFRGGWSISLTFKNPRSYVYKHKVKDGRGSRSFIEPWQMSCKSK
jgi:hypothetical protein